MLEFLAVVSNQGAALPQSNTPAQKIPNQTIALLCIIAVLVLALCLLVIYISCVKSGGVRSQRKIVQSAPQRHHWKAQVQKLDLEL